MNCERGVSEIVAIRTYDVYVGLGSNQGDRLAALQRAVKSLNNTDGIDLISASPVYETEAHVHPGSGTQPDHLNAVVGLRTKCTAEDLLVVLKRVEQEAGRVAEAPKWSPRPLDLDLLLFGDQIIEEDCGGLNDLVVPHPRMAVRRFVLQPLVDLVHNLVVPGADNETVSDLLARCPDTLRVERTELRLVDDHQSPL